jgi:hypothetical protein
MSVTEYLDKFTHLSCYTPDEVNTDLKRQERFLDGLIGPLNYQLQSHTFLDFQTLLNKAIGLESKRKELGKQKHMFQSHGQSSSNTRPRFSSQQSPSQYCPGGQGGRYPQNLQLQRSFQPQHFNPHTPRAPNPQQSRSNNGSRAPVKNTTPVQPNGCFKCGELGHYANNCPKRAVQTPQRVTITCLCSHPHSLTLHKLLAREASRTICVVGLIMYLWNKLIMTPAWCWVRFLSTLYPLQYCLIREHQNHP